jgi:hypothetical protein
VLAALVLAAGALVPCKGSAELGGAGVVGVPEFVPDTATARTRFVTVEKERVNGSRIVLDVVLHNIDQPVTGVALKITYPNTIARFSTCTDGNLFPPGTCYASETPPAGSGEVFLARTVASASQATTVIGAKIALRVEFIVSGKGSGPIVFEAQNLGGGDASAVLDANGDPILMTWYSGTLLGR